MSRQPADSHGGRVYGLDILRACAILTVLYGHGYTLIARYVPLKPYAFLSLNGVTAFFVLSGYLIGGILLKMLAADNFGMREAGAFWLRRWLRTLPAYYLVLALLFGTALIGLQAPPPHLRHYLFFVQSLAWPHPDFFGEAWSLVVEEWFYLLLPAALLLSARLVRREHRQTLLLAWTLALMAAVTCYRARLAIDHAFPDVRQWDEWLRKIAACRLDSIGYGVVGAWIRLKRPDWWMRHPRVLLCAGLALLEFQQIEWLVLADNFYFNTLYFILGPLGALLLLPALSALRTGSGWVYRFFSFISAISYPMYLVNLGLVQVSLMPWLFGPQILQPQNPAVAALAYCAYWVFTLVIATLIHRHAEQPIMDWRDRRIRPQAVI